MLDRLAEWKGRYGTHDSGELERLLDTIAAEKFSDPSDLIRLHETLLFLRTYPHSAGVARRAEKMLRGFAKRVRDAQGADRENAEAFQSPEVSGIAGTTLTAVFSYGVARRLAERHPTARIDWEAYAEPDRMGPVLRRILPFLEEDWPVEAHTPFEQWVGAAVPRGQTDLRWLLARMDTLALDERDRADLYDSMQLPLYWELKNSPHTRSRVYGSGRIHYNTAPLLGRKDVSLREAFTAPPLPAERISRRDAERILDIILDTSAVRYRELYGFTHPDAARVFRVNAGRGLEIYWFGIPPAWRLPLRAYHAGMFFQNGVPAGYIETLSLFDRAEVGFNLYYTFREGEAAWIYARLLQLTHQMLGVNTIVVDPYQIGHENDEALDSGAFWFYRKLGFVPVQPEIGALLEKEEHRIARSPGHRSSRTMLRKLAAGYVRFEGPEAEPGAWDHFHLRNIEFAVAKGRGSTGAWDAMLELIPNLPRWTAAEKSALAGVIKSKSGPDEARYLQLMQRHTKLREAVLRLGSGE